MPGRFVIVSGNIATGKSTLAEILAPTLGVRYIPEPWDDNPFFESYYRDPSSWALQTQLHFQVGAAHAHAEIACHGEGGVQDRGMYEMYYVFARQMHRDGYLRDDELELCARLLHLCDDLLPAPDLLVYLECPINEALRRSEARQRGGELLASDMLQGLYDRYREYIAEWTRSPVVRVDSGTVDFRDANNASVVMDSIVAALR
ncbi:MAG TPA: deoxynucleoside kinase [Solirubrobacteraceae bacterium]|jgi:deoxyadenosine/deoxycytidine kinase